MWWEGGGVIKRQTFLKTFLRSVVHVILTKMHTVGPIKLCVIDFKSQRKVNLSSKLGLSTLHN